MEEKHTVICREKYSIHLYTMNLWNVFFRLEWL